MIIDLTNKKILVTGAHGMLGTAVVNYLRQLGCEEVFTPRSTEYDLRDREATELLIYKYRPEYVIHLAAKVGGLKANMDGNSAFFEDNIRINTNVLQEARNWDVKKVVSILSTCIYPREEFVKYPLTEDQLELGPPHESNFGYAYAKRMLHIQSKAYNQDPTCETKYVCAIPNNLFGPKDNFDLETSHVVPAVIRKAYEFSLIKATTDEEFDEKYKQAPKFWGHPATLREFTYASDAARAIVFLLQESDISEGSYNIGSTVQTAILDLIRTVTYETKTGMPIIFEKGTPIGQKMKPSSNKKFMDAYYKAYGKEFEYRPLYETLRETFNWYKKHREECHE